MQLISVSNSNNVLRTHDHSLYRNKDRKGDLIKLTMGPIKKGKIISNGNVVMLAWPLSHVIAVI